MLLCMYLQHMNDLLGSCFQLVSKSWSFKILNWIELSVNGLKPYKHLLLQNLQQVTVCNLHFDYSRCATADDVTVRVLYKLRQLNTDDLMNCQEEENASG